MFNFQILLTYIPAKTKIFYIFSPFSVPEVTKLTLKLFLRPFLLFFCCSAIVRCTMQCNAMQCNATQCNAMQCNALQCTMCINPTNG